MKLHNLIALIAMAATNVGIIVPAVVKTATSLNQHTENIEDDSEDLTGITSVKVVTQPNKTVYQEGEYFNPEGMMCLVTQNGIKKIAKDNFVVLLDRPLTQTDTSVPMKYGDFEFSVQIKVLCWENIITIDKNGSYIVQAEDSRLPLDGYIEADSAWSAAHYDGVNEVTKYVETWTNSRFNPSSGKSLANIAVGSVLGFKFTVAKDCNINVNAMMAMYDTKKPSDLLTFKLDDEEKDDVDKSLVLTHLKDADDSGAKYFNWQNWSMGTYPVTAGVHTFTITVKDFKLPNLDYFKIIATDMEGGDAVNITGNGTFTLASTDPTIDRTNWVSDGAGRGFEEDWHTDGSTDVEETSGRSIGHLGNLCQIVFPISLSGRAKVQVNILAATPDNLNASQSLSVKIDATKLENPDTDLVFTSSSVSQYWNWKRFNAGTLDISKGGHIVTIAVNKAVNLLKYEFVVTNYEDGAYGAITLNQNGTHILQAESGLLNRTQWSVRSDFVQAGREPVENWTTSHTTEISETSGVSLCGLNSGCIIEIPFEAKGELNLQFQIVNAYPDALACKSLYTITLDDKKLEDPDLNETLGSAGTENPGQLYWNWKIWNAGNMALKAGQHTLKIQLNLIANVDSFRFVVTNYK